MIYGILSGFFGLKLIIPCVALAQLCTASLRFWVFRGAIHWRLACYFFLGVLPGISGGTFLFHWLSERALRRALGVFVLGFVVYECLQRQAIRVAPRVGLLPPGGCCAGILSGSIGGGRPAAGDGLSAVWLAARGTGGNDRAVFSARECATDAPVLAPGSVVWGTCGPRSRSRSGHAGRRVSWTADPPTRGADSFSSNWSWGCLPCLVYNSYPSHKPTVSLDVISLVASRCGHDRGPNRATRYAGMRRTRGDAARACQTSTIPPSAARSARCASAGASLQGSTAAPEAWHRSGPLARSGTTRWRAREGNNPIASPCHGMRCPPASPLFASWPWPRHHAIRVGTHC